MTDLFKFLVTAPEAVILLLYVVVPGFVYMKVYDVLAPGERRSLGEAIIDTLGFSFMLMAFWFWPFILLYEHSDSLGTWLRYLIVFVLSVLAAFVTPALVAYLVYRGRHHNFLTGKTSQPSPTSWDWFFLAKADNYYVRFHLKTGEQFGGYYGENSFATSFPHREEIYIEEVWRLDEDGKFAEQIESTKGAFVNREDCTLVEFLEVGAAPGKQDGPISIPISMAEETNTGEEVMRGEGYQSGKQNFPNRVPPRGVSITKKGDTGTSNAHH